MLPCVFDRSFLHVTVKNLKFGGEKGGKFLVFLELFGIFTNFLEKLCVFYEYFHGTCVND